MSRVADICTAVVTGLNAHDFTEDFTAEKNYCDRPDVSEVSALRVMVSPQAKVAEKATRTSFQEGVPIYVGIVKKLPNRETATVEAMLQLVEDIGDLFKDQALATDPRAVFVGLESDAWYDEQMLQESAVFFSIITLIFQQVVET